MSFLLVIIFMIIENSRGPDHSRLLVGRSGNQDQVVGKVDEDELTDQPDRVPGNPRSDVAVPVVGGRGSSILALAAGDLPENSAVAGGAAGNGNSDASAKKPTAADSSAPAAKGGARAPSSHQQAESTATPAFVMPSNEPSAAPASPIADHAAGTSPQTNAKNPAAKPLPPAMGVTDEDPDEASAADEDLQYIDDDSPGIVKSEMPAYERIVRWVVDQSYQRMAARTQLKKLNYAQIVGGADDERGKLFKFDMHIRRAIAYDDKLHFYSPDEDSHDPVQLYEMWGSTEESRSRLYQLVVYDPPAGMPLGPNIQEDVRFVGYFFKLQGYQPAKALPGARPEIAPTFIGRIVWMERPPGVMINRSDIWWIAAIGGALLLGLIGWIAWLLLCKARPNVGQLSVDLSIPPSAAVSIDQWLEQPQPGGSSTDRQSRRDEIDRSEQAGPWDGEQVDGDRPGSDRPGSDGSGSDPLEGDRFGDDSADATDETDGGDTEPEPRPKPLQNGHGNGRALFSDRPDQGRL